MKFKSSLIALCALATLASCGEINSLTKSKRSGSNRVTNEAPVNALIGDKDVELQVISKSLMNNLLPVSNIKVKSLLNSLSQDEKSVESQRAKNNSNKAAVTSQKSLLVGYPIGLLGEQNIFGGVITKVSDRESDTLGTLKLTDLTPIHSRAIVTGASTDSPSLTLIGCMSKCAEDSVESGLISIPIVGYNEETNMLILDMSAIGNELNLIGMLDPAGQYTKLISVSSETTSVEYDLKTLLFDIKTKMVPVGSDEKDPKTPITEFTVRWYLKLNSSSTQGFVARKNTKGVGFFETEKSVVPKIHRFSTAPSQGEGQASVKYYIKNVPAEFKKHFARAFDSWNVEFKKTIGRNFLSYEFIDATDPRSELLVTGDIRYNIVEWDLVNKAGYGGLGPSIADQFTGEILSANVLVQGPTIVKLYTEWFRVSAKVNELRSQNQMALATQLIKDFTVSAKKEVSNRTKARYAVKLGNLEMTVHAQREHLEDPIIKGEFEIVPAGMTYDTYMEGYMLEILAHELGHNLGLRHNFKGNLGSDDSRTAGSVSRSVMEYLGRPYRHLNTIGEYDRMAIAYGYKGVAPKNLNWFCTDENQGSDAATLVTASAECTKSDATNDPFSFWEGRLTRVLDLILETSSNSAPVWKTEEVKSQIEEATIGLSAYALSAEATADTWTNFFGKKDRPENKAQVKDYVLTKMKNKLCNSDLSVVIAGKESAEGINAAEANLAAMREMVAAKTTSLGLFTAEQLKCE